MKDREERSRETHIVETLPKIKPTEPLDYSRQREEIETDSTPRSS